MKDNIENLLLAQQFPVFEKDIISLVFENRKELISFCKRRGLSNDDAQDAVQDLLLWALENRLKIYQGPRLIALFYKFLKFRILNQVKCKPLLVKGEDDDFIDRESLSDIKLEQTDFIEALSKDVGPKVAYIWYYRNIKDYPYYKLAKSFGCSEFKIRCMLELAKESSLLGGHRRHRSKYALIGSLYRKPKKTERNLFERRGRPPKIKQWTSDNPPSYQHEYDFEKHFTYHVKCRRFVLKNNVLIPLY